MENPMKLRTHILTLVAAGLLGVGGYGLFSLGVRHGATMPSGTTTQGATPSVAGGALKAGDVDPSNGKKILYWHDPMVPAQKFDRPGKSPFMDMMLVPVYAG